MNIGEIGYTYIKCINMLIFYQKVSGKTIYDYAITKFIFIS